MELNGAVALVTGASEGIGRAIAIGLAAEGAHVALLARSRARLDEVADAIESARGPGDVLVVPTDVRDQAAVAAAARAVGERFGRLLLARGDFHPLALESFPHFRAREGSHHRLVERVDDLLGRPLRGVEPRPERELQAALVAGLRHGRDVRERCGALGRGHGKAAQLAGLHLWRGRRQRGGDGSARPAGCLIPAQRHVQWQRDHDDRQRIVDGQLRIAGSGTVFRWSPDVLTTGGVLRFDASPLTIDVRGAPVWNCRVRELNTDMNSPSVQEAWSTAWELLNQGQTLRGTDLIANDLFQRNAGSPLSQRMGGSVMQLIAATEQCDIET